MASDKKTPKTDAVEAAETVEAPKKSRWAQMRDEARAKAAEKRKAQKPYMFDGTEPPTPVYPPTSTEHVALLARVFDKNAEVTEGEMLHVLHALFNDSFDTIWAVIKDEPVEVIFDLFQDVVSYVQDSGVLPSDDEVADVAGGA